MWVDYPNKTAESDGVKVKSSKSNNDEVEIIGRFFSQVKYNLMALQVSTISTVGAQ